MRTIQNSRATVEVPVEEANRAAVVFVFGVMFLDLLGMTLLIPVTPSIVHQYSQQALMVTLMTVLYAAAQFASAPLLGRLSDHYGRRPVLLICILGSAFGYFLFGIGGALWVLFLARLIDGFTGGNISTATAYIADVTPPQERAKYFGLMGAAFGTGFILGPAFGGALSQIHVTAPAYAAGSFSLLSGIIGFFILPESLPAEKRVREVMRWSEINPFLAIANLLRRPELKVLLLVQATFNFVTTGFNSIAAVYFLRAFDASPLQIAGVLVAVGIANILVQAGLIGKLVKRFSEHHLAVFGMLFQGIQVAGTVLVPSYGLMYWFQGLTSGGAGPVRPALNALLANRVPQQEQGRLNGVGASLNSLMSVFGPLAAGLAFDHIAPQAPFWFGGFLLCLAAAWLTIAERRSLRRKG